MGGGGDSQREVRVRSGGQGRGGDASGEQDTSRRQHKKEKTEEVEPARTLQPIILGIEHDYLGYGTR